MKIRFVGRFELALVCGVRMCGVDGVCVMSGWGDGEMGEGKGKKEEGGWYCDSGYGYGWVYCIHT